MSTAKEERKSKRLRKTNLSVSVLLVNCPCRHVVKAVHVLFTTVAAKKSEKGYYRPEVELTAVVLKVAEIDKNPIYLLWLI